jgi:HD superfamily phosphohydrolase
MPTTIKDPVHGYIELDAFEEKVIDSPWFQRLRRVKQNDVCSIVYPTMLTTRFEHSLGAMHLAGACIRAALEDEASRENVRKFLRFLEGELRGLGIEVASDVLPLFARRCARMYGALHDIGHPPYSHLIESCFTALEIGLPVSAATHWHEANGEEIVRRHLPASVAATGEDSHVLCVVAELARKDLSAPALLAIKHLVDSVVDVDRMDFVLRDGRASGSEFGTYDLRRLVSSFRVHVVELNSAPQQILIRPLNKALSAIESLIQERYKLYRWCYSIIA